MYSLHPTMIEVLANQRADELNRHAAQLRRCQSKWETGASCANASSRGTPSIWAR